MLELVLGYHAAHLPPVPPVLAQCVSWHSRARGCGRGLSPQLLHCPGVANARERLAAVSADGGLEGLVVCPYLWRPSLCRSLSSPERPLAEAPNVRPRGLMSKLFGRPTHASQNNLVVAGARPGSRLPTTIALAHAVQVGAATTSTAGPQEFVTASLFGALRHRVVGLSNHNALPDGVSCFGAVALVGRHARISLMYAVVRSASTVADEPVRGITTRSVVWHHWQRRRWRSWERGRCRRFYGLRCHARHV